MRTGSPLAALTAAFVLALSGCGSDSGDPALTVYLSAPLSGPSATDGRDVADGARLALDDAGGSAGGVRVRLEVLDGAAARGAGGARAGANARTATEDSTAIAYIGELDSGPTRTSEPITNEAGLLQVSAGASATDLTRAAPGSDQVPKTQPTGVRTFARVIPSDVAQGAAAAGAAGDAGARAVRLYGSGDRYEESLRYGWESVSGAPPLGAGAGADAIYDAASRPGLATAARASSRFGADAQIFGSPPRSVMPAGSLLVSGTLAPSQLPGSDFADRFRDAYDRSPGRFAAYGYEAMASAVDAIDRADDPLDRKSVVDAYFDIADRDSVLGAYSIDGLGDTTLDRVGAYEATARGRLDPAPAPLGVP